MTTVSLIRRAVETQKVRAMGSSLIALRRGHGKSVFSKQKFPSSLRAVSLLLLDISTYFPNVRSRVSQSYDPLGHKQRS